MHARDKASDIEGGHGNGGKAFMVLGSTTDSSFESCFEGLRNRMGYDNVNEKARFKPGIAIENGKPIENQPVESIRRQFDQSLRNLASNSIGCRNRRRRSLKSDRHIPSRR